MKLDQTAVVFRVGRRRLRRHIAALRSQAAEGRRALAAGDLAPEAQSRLELTVERLETNVADLERALDAVAKPEPSGQGEAYVAWARD